MDSEVLIAILALAGTALGTGGGILAANKLVIFRIEQLEKKVDRHNNLIERMYKVENRIKVLELEEDN